MLERCCLTVVGSLPVVEDEFEVEVEWSPLVEPLVSFVRPFILFGLGHIKS